MNISLQLLKQGNGAGSSKGILATFDVFPELHCMNALTYHLQPFKKFSFWLLLNSPQLSAIFIGVLLKSLSYAGLQKKEITL